MSSIRIKTLPMFSAIYYALLQNGYEYYRLMRSDTHIEQVEQFISTEHSFPYFASAKQNTCEVYPFWPRAALLEVASFHVDPPKASYHDFDVLRQKIMSASNLKEEERNVDLWNWLEDFPFHLSKVMNDTGFHSYFAWESEWLENQRNRWRHEIEVIEKAILHCSKTFQLQLPEVEILISPIKCVHSSDYHLVDNRFIYTGGDLKTSFVIHEFLHPVIHPFIIDHHKSIQSRKMIFRDIDSSYYLGGTDEGYLNAFEEKLVRTLTDALMIEQSPEELQIVLHQLMNQ